MSKQKYLFIDRDGTLINEPEDKQIDSVEKLDFLPGIFSAMETLQKQNFKLVMVSNQDGLGTSSFPETEFKAPHELMMSIFTSQGIKFDEVLICPHFPEDNCNCRKPEVGLVLEYLKSQCIDRKNSYVIGDRETDLKLAENMGIEGIQIGSEQYKDWSDIINYLVHKPRTASIARKTNETNIKVNVNLDQPGQINVETGIGFFDHMLEQLAKHSGISLTIQANGDLHIDDHHTVEDIGIAIGQAIREALGDKLGIARYGFLLPMDESLVQVALDLSGRFTCIINANYSRDKVGELSTEMVKHFFYSLAEGMRANLHITVKGENAHHMVEGTFKSFGRALGQAIKQVSSELPTTKGML
ncbi:bifunctional histidinol-phosphatase/imidazoleglycerol-phosphate dehydratase HisB [Francisellaceae bacterium]|nr:bifunctional histidinol-phosphatase/imidazoleglycerol-phosphate dehydratase HisB [Francisellaceae bacterium]